MRLPISTVTYKRKVGYETVDDEIVAARKDMVNMTINKQLQ